MKRIIILSLIILSKFVFSQNIIPNYPEEQNPYKNGNIELFKDINTWLVENNEKPCEKNEFYWVTLRINENGKPFLIRNKSDQYKCRKK